MLRAAHTARHGRRIRTIDMLRGFAALALVATLSCGDGATEPPPPDPPRPTTVTVTPATVEFNALGATRQLTAEVRDQNGQVMAGAAVSWSSSSAAAATVDAQGLVTAVGEGTATITATAGSAVGTSRITVATLDRAALVALYEATDGPNWVNNENWLSDAPLGEWYGVDTDNSGRVVRLDLDGRWDSDAQEHIPHGLSGPVPPELGNLANLTRLDLGHNFLSGPVPTELGHLTDLEFLHLGGNDLTGPIPTELGELGSLTWLSLYANTLTGPIPPELGELGSLTWLWLYSNSLTGPIPTELGRLADLESLNLGGNDLTGPIPPEFGELASLTWLSLDSNSLTGSIPPELGNLANLEVLYLSYNDLTGPIPESFLEWEALERFRFEGNADLCAPGTIDFVTWLEGIEDTSGPYCNESDLGVLNLLYETSGGPDWTNSSGWLETPLLDDWYGVTANALGRVLTLDLSRNGLAGQLPYNLSGLAHMTELRIAQNTDLSGRLPLSLADLSLRALHYDGTELCTPVYKFFRDWLSAIPSHEGTGVECGPLDREVLEVLYDATGGPDWTHNENWRTDAPLGEWYGVEVDDQGRVVGLGFLGNRLTGRIPRELGGLANLESLHLYRGGLTGPIPPELGDLANLESLSLGENDLTGPIPPELGGLANLQGLVPPRK